MFSSLGDAESGRQDEWARLLTVVPFSQAITSFVSRPPDSQNGLFDRAVRSDRQLSEFRTQ